jgi:hypothetical protein
VRGELLAFLDLDDPSPDGDADAGASAARWRLRREDGLLGAADQRRTPPLSTKPVLPAFAPTRLGHVSRSVPAIGYHRQLRQLYHGLKRAELVKRTKL